MPDYVHVHTYLGVSYLVFNTHDVPALRDRRVRLALDMAIDRDFITSKLLRGGQLPAYTFVPPGVANYQPVTPPIWASWPFPRRQAAARALLAEAGYGPGHPLKLEIKQRNTPDADPGACRRSRPTGGPSACRSAMPPGGGPDRLSGPTASATSRSADAAWIADYNDADELPRPAAVARPARRTTATTTTRPTTPCSPRPTTSLTPPSAPPICARAETIMLDDAAGDTRLVLWLSKNLVNPKITGWVDNITDWHRVQYLCVKK